MRFKYLNIVPWNFCNADTPAGAARFLEGATSLPFEQQDELTKYLYHTHRADLEATAAGGAVSASLQEEVLAVNETPLDESAGEGYHRSTNCTRIRARNSSSAYIKQSTRTHQNVEMMKTMVKSRRGKMVLRYEWRAWKRVLQTRPKKQWTPLHLKNKDFLRRLYREDARAEDNWAIVLRKQQAAGKPHLEPVGGNLQAFATLHRDLSCIGTTPRCLY